MKLPFVSRKKYEVLENNFKLTSAARRDLNNEFVRVQRDLVELQTTNRNLGIELDKCEVDIVEYKKEIKRLKFLLSKNKINYKKEK